MSKDVTFVKDGATKTLPESYSAQMLSQGWEVEGANALQDQLAKEAAKSPTKEKTKGS